MTEQKDSVLRHYIESVQALWLPASATDPHAAQQVRDLMQAWLTATPSDTDWVKALKEDQPPGRPLHTDPDHGFIQMSHYHEGFRSNSPHDHGPYWVVYGVYEGEVEIPVYAHDPASDTVRVSRLDRLKAGDAVAYLPGEIHSTRVPTAEPAIVLRFLSTDLTKVQRQRFKPEQVII